MEDCDAELRDELRAHSRHGGGGSRSSAARIAATTAAAARAARAGERLADPGSDARHVGLPLDRARCCRTRVTRSRVFGRNPGFAAVAIAVARARHRREHGALPAGRRGAARSRCRSRTRARLVEIRPVRHGRRPRPLRDVAPFGDVSRSGRRSRARRRHSPASSRGAPTHTISAPAAKSDRATRSVASGRDVRRSSACGRRPDGSLSPDDDRPGCAPRAVLSYAYWQRAFGGSPSAVGQTLTLGTPPRRDHRGRAAGLLRHRSGPRLRCRDAALRRRRVQSTDGMGRLAVGHRLVAVVFGRLNRAGRSSAPARISPRFLPRFSRRRCRRTIHPSARRST